MTVRQPAWTTPCLGNNPLMSLTSRSLSSLLLICMFMGSCVRHGCGEETTLGTELSSARAAKGTAAADMYRALAAKYPQEVVVWFELGDALYDTNAWQDALQAYEKAAQLGWKPARVNTRIGKCLQKLKRPPEAEAAFRRALEADPQVVAAQFGLAAALFSQDNKAAAAVPLFEELVKRQDEWGDVSREYLAQAYFDIGRYDAALTHVDALLAKAPQDATFRWLAARTLFKLRRYEDALLRFQQVAQSDPKRAEAARYYVAACMEGLGRKREAEEAYGALAKGASVWSEAARSGAGRLAGAAFRFTLDYAAGYDSNVVRNNPDATPGGQKDAFNQVFADVNGRVLRTHDLNIWLGAEHFGLHYPKLHDNDYTQDTAKIAFNVPDVGPFGVVAVRYELNYSSLAYDSFRREHRVEASALYRTSTDRLDVGLAYGDNKYFGEYSGVSGPEANAWLDYRHQLPAWDHELRLRLRTELRFSNDEGERRVVEYARLQYRSRITRVLYGQVELGYRRGDYTQSRISTVDFTEPRRVDSRWSGEVQFDWQVHRHVFVNWGYVFEKQKSTRDLEQYKRHQGTIGFTVMF